jgi:ABC-type uncharacterized transport system substrate-binding protein
MKLFSKLRPFLPALALAAAPAAIAHPHVWIEMTSAVGFNPQGQITALGIAWTFDEFYSMAAVDGQDKNKNGKFDEAELKELATLYLTNLQKYGYFTAVEVDGKAPPHAKADSPRAIFKDGRLTFTFRLPLAKPVDPKTQKFSYSSFDPSYYIDIQPAKVGGVRMGTNAPKGCGFAIRQAEGPTPPMALNLGQSLNQPPPPDGIFGMLPAAVVDIRCQAVAQR